MTDSAEAVGSGTFIGLCDWCAQGIGLALAQSSHLPSQATLSWGSLCYRPASSGCFVSSRQPGAAAAASFRYERLIQQKRLGQGRSLDFVAGVHKELVLHLRNRLICHHRRHCPGEVSVSVYLCHCRHVSPAVCFYQKSAQGTSWLGAWRLSRSRTSAKDGCFMCKGEHFAVDCPD